MTVPVLDTGSLYTSLTSAPSSRDLLYRLKDIKNALIGNPLRKAEIARSREIVSLLTEYVHADQETAIDLTRLEILNEAAVILGSIANSISDSVLDSLLCAHLHTALLNAICVLTVPPDPKLQSYILTKALPSLIRALRNHLITIADFLWGWGSRSEPGTKVILDSVLDLEEDVTMDVDPPAIEVGGKGEDFTRSRARAALLSVYKVKSLKALLSLLTDSQFSKQPQVVLPLLQLLAQTAILSSQRMALYEWNRNSSPSKTPPEDDRDTARSRSTVRFSPLGTVEHHEATTSPLIEILCAMVLGNGALGTKANSNFKLKQAGLDLLTVLVKDKSAALEAMSVLQEYGGIACRAPVRARDPAVSEDKHELRIMTDLLDSRVPGIGISAAACLVSFRIITSQDVPFRKMADREAWRGQAQVSAISGSSLLEHLSQFMDTAQSPDDRIKACYLTARLVQDDPDLQRKAIETNAIARCVEVVKAGDREQPSSNSKEQSTANIQAPLLGPVVARRMVEAGLTAIATLCTFHEPAKQKAIQLGVLPLINRSLQSPAYATRTSACQVARVLSRSIAILRTTLVDSGVAKNVVGLLQAEEQVYAANGGYEKDFKLRSSTSSTALSAATATICNLICEFSPMQATFMAQDGVQTLVRLTDAADREVRVNSIWALRNMVFKSDESLRKKVVEALGWGTLRRHLLDSQPEVAEQALAFTRNLIAEASEAEITHLFEGVGEESLFEAIESAMSGIDRVNTSLERDGVIGRPEYEDYHSQASDRLEQALFVLYNIALGNEQHREAILKRSNVLAGMQHALYITESPLIKIPAIGGFINLVETNDRHRRTRQEVINRLRPYLLPVQVRALCSDPSFDVRDKAGKLLAILEVGMFTSGSGSATA